MGASTAIPDAPRNNVRARTATNRLLPTYKRKEDGCSGGAREPSGRGPVVTFRIVLLAARASACAVGFLMIAGASPSEAANRPLPGAKSPAAYASTKAPVAATDPATTSS